MLKNNPYLKLMRTDLPAGYLFLFFPCLFSITSTSRDFKTGVYFAALFLLGSYLMHGFGCIINDILDKDIDKYVERTADRPLAADKISIRNALILAGIVLILSGIILLQFNLTTILIGLFSLPLVSLYPLAKRYFPVPQLALGLIFNFGAIMGWTAVSGDFSWQMMVIYFGCICWTMCYDTIYAVPDMWYDKDLGIHSSARIFDPHIKLWVSLFYGLMLFFFAFLGNIWILLGGFAVILEVLRRLDLEEAKSCKRFFDFNILLGLVIFLSLL